MNVIKQLCLHGNSERVSCPCIRCPHLLLQVKRGKQLPISTRIMQIYSAARVKRRLSTTVWLQTHFNWILTHFIFESREWAQAESQLWPTARPEVFQSPSPPKPGLSGRAGPAHHYWYDLSVGKWLELWLVSAYMRKVTGSLRSESFANVKSSRLSLSMTEDTLRSRGMRKLDSHWHWPPESPNTPTV